MSCTASTSLHPLITQTLVDTKKFFCPFLEKGYCREASRCNFSHDNHESIKIPTDYCHFYLANQCLYGQDCKFRHTEPICNGGGGGGGGRLTNNNNNHDEETGIPYIAASSSAAPTAHSSSQYLPLDHPLTSSTLLDADGAHCSSSSYATTSSNANAEESNQENRQLFEDMSYRFSSSLPSLTSTANLRPLTSFAKVCKSKTSVNEQSDISSSSSSSNYKKNYPLCPYSSTTGVCHFPPGHCSYLHGLDCDLCGRPCLHPYDLDQQRQHREDCLREHEREMELSFAVQRSKDKVCGICMDTVVEKKPITSSRFGILEKCNHIFCLDCIRKWRGTKTFETRTIRACPECRVSSDFVVPSKYWVEDQDDKEKLIHDYKEALRSKPCKYFDEGKGTCPFAGSCFYKHAYPDGRIAKLETPKPRRRVFGARGPSSIVANYILWNVLTSTDEDDWSNDELESLYLDPDYGTSVGDDDDEDDLPDEMFPDYD